MHDDDSVTRKLGTFGAVFEALRVHQWIKNLLIFLPLLLGGKATDIKAWRQAFFGFLALAFWPPRLTSSTISRIGRTTASIRVRG